MSRFDLSVIHTDSKGNPIPRPEPLPENSTIEERIAWQRACNDYFDRVTSLSNRFFDKKLRKSLKL